MYTKKADTYQKFCGEVRKLFGEPFFGCMTCATENNSQEIVDKVVVLLKEHKIDPEKVEAEMRTVSEFFAFKQGWKDRREKCNLPGELFLAVCYKFFS